MSRPNATPLTDDQRELAATCYPLARLMALRVANHGGRPDLADDLTGAAMIGLCRAARAYDPTLGFAFGTTAGLAAMRMAAQELARLTRLRCVPLPTGGDGESWEPAAPVPREPAPVAGFDDAWLEAALGRLPAAARRALRLVYAEGRTYAEAEAAAGGSVKGAATRGLAALRRLARDAAEKGVAA